MGTVFKLNIITGETGCGKTYSTIKKLQNDNTSFVYIAPCRQLVYETFIEYSHPEDDLSTGEVKIINKQYGNLFAVYESLNVEQIKNYSALIIDEAHFLCDEDRGANLSKLLDVAKEQQKEIYLLTATNSLRKKDFPHYKTTYMPTLEAPPKVEIGWTEFEQRMMSGIPTIFFCGSINEAINYADELQSNGVKAASLTSLNTPSKRLITQYKFKTGQLTTICATNLLAQGVNFTCSNLFIERSMWNTDELLLQKLGRLGRPYNSQMSDVVTYCTSCPIPKQINKRQQVKNFTPITNGFYLPEVPRGQYTYNNKTIEVNSSGRGTSNNFEEHQVIEYLGGEDTITYNLIKYSMEFIGFLKLLCEEHNLINTTLYQNILVAEGIFTDEGHKVKQLITQYRKNN